MLENYHQNPVSIPESVATLETIEDRCLAVKLAYMLICVGYQPQEDSIPPTEKAMYRQMIELLDLDENLIKEIEWEASRERRRCPSRDHPPSSCRGHPRPPNCLLPSTGARTRVKRRKRMSTSI